MADVTIALPRSKISDNNMLVVALWWRAMHAKYGTVTSISPSTTTNDSAHAGMSGGIGRHAVSHGLRRRKWRASFYAARIGRPIRSPSSEGQDGCRPGRLIRNGVGPVQHVYSTRQVSRSVSFPCPFTFSFNRLIEDIRHERPAGGDLGSSAFGSKSQMCVSHSGNVSSV